MDHSIDLPCTSPLVCLNIDTSPRQLLWPADSFHQWCYSIFHPNKLSVPSRLYKLPFAREIKLIVITTLNYKILDGRGYVFLIFPTKTLTILCRKYARYWITVCWMNEKNLFWKHSPSGFQPGNCGSWFQSGYIYTVTFGLHNNSRK